TLLGQTAAFGTLIFNGCKQGADCSGSDTSGYRDLAVSTRLYTIPAGQASPVNQPTNAQAIPGTPWYYYVSSTEASVGLNRVFISGLRNTGNPGDVGTYRSSIGLMNASQYSTTTIVVK